LGIEMVGNSLIRFPDAITHFKLSSHRTVFGRSGRYRHAERPDLHGHCTRLAPSVWAFRGRI